MHTQVYEAPTSNLRLTHAFVRHVGTGACSARTPPSSYPSSHCSSSASRRTRAARWPCHPAYAEAGDARTLDPDAYKKLCCSTKETKEVVTQYHTIYGLPGWCTDAYLKWDGAAQGDIKDRGRGQG